jgi:NAD(P)H-dependent FMN reductase
MPTQTKPDIVAICGSLRNGSRTRTAVNEGLTASAQAGGATELVDLRSYDLPSLNAVENDVPDAQNLRETVSRADSVLLGTPNYHGSYSGALKNALDYCGREEFEGTTVGLLEVAAGEFPGSALIHLRTVSRTLRAWTLPIEVAIPDSHSLITDGGINDPDLARRIQRLGRELVDYAGVTDYPELSQRPTTPAIDRQADK